MVCILQTGLQGAEGTALLHKYMSFPQNGAFPHLLWHWLHLDIWTSGSISGVWVEDHRDSYRAQVCWVSSKKVDGEIPRGGLVSSVYSAEIFDVVKYVLLPPPQINK